MFPLPCVLLLRLSRKLVFADSSTFLLLLAPWRHDTFHYPPDTINCTVFFECVESRPWESSVPLHYQGHLLINLEICRELAGWEARSPCELLSYCMWPMTDSVCRRAQPHPRQGTYDGGHYVPQGNVGGPTLPGKRIWPLGATLSQARAAEFLGVVWSSQTLLLLLPWRKEGSVSAWTAAYWICTASRLRMNSLRSSGLHLKICIRNLVSMKFLTDLWNLLTFFIP